ncbi:MAG: hypothetical protein JEZ09_14430 [Salinivirgaceae bacterium]|nr:hypothetical protein [Salinivirgaceae bacterium]
MKKPRKITVKPFLNDKLEGIETCIQENDTERETFLFPLYYMVIYNRNNTKFKSRLGFYYETIEEASLEMISFESKTIEKILRYQISKSEDEVNLKGLGNHFNILSEDLFYCTEKYLKAKLKFFALKADGRLSFIINFDDFRNSFTKYYEVITQLFTGIEKYFDKQFELEVKSYEQYKMLREKEHIKPFSAPVIIDWLNGSYKPFIQRKITSETDQKHIFSLIESVVQKQLKFID